MLFDVKEVLKSQRTRLNIKHEIKRFDDVFEHLTKKDCDNTFTFKDKDRSDNINDNNDVHLKSDDSIFK